MTGKELILSILQNGLENEEVLNNGNFVGFISEEEAAEKFNVDVSTVKLWRKLGLIKGIRLGDSEFFLKNVQAPKKLSLLREE